MEEKKKGGFSQLLQLLLAILIGIGLGCYLSAELHYFQFPRAERTFEEVRFHTGVTLILSPFLLLFSLLQILSFKLHGFMIWAGVIMTFSCARKYRRTFHQRYLVGVMIGMILWSHYNTMLFEIIMSV